jgi:hypothetical protein
MSSAADSGDDPRFVSMAFDDMPRPDFADVVVVPIPGDGTLTVCDPRWWAAAVFDTASAPAWIKLFFVIRQALVGLIGVSPGRASVFAVKEVRGEEALIAANDRHLDFRAAVGVDASRGLLRITTAVRLHGWRGRLYFLPVSLLHEPITRSMARAAVRRHAVACATTSG